MKRLAIAPITLALAIGAVACSDDNASAPSSTTVLATTVAAQTDDTAANRSTTVAGDPLRELLLDIDDLPTGWRMEYSPENAEFGSFGDSSCEGHSVDPAIVDRVRPTIAVKLTSPDGAVTIEQSIFTGDPEQIAADLTAVFAVDSACFGAETVEADGSKTLYEPLDLPTLGDRQESATWNYLTGADLEPTAAGHIAIIQVGSVAMEIAQVESLTITGGQAAFGVEEFVEVLQTAVAKARR
jgi:hypothetical protein